MAILKNYQDILDTNPLLRLVIPLMAGIGCGHLFDAWWSQWGICFFFISFVAIGFCVAVYRGPGDLLKRYFPFYTALSLALFSLGSGLYLSSSQKTQVTWPDQEIGVRVMLVDTPKEGEKVWQSAAEIQGGDYDGKKIRLTLLKKGAQQKESSGQENASCDEGLRTGDCLLLQTFIQPPHNAGNPSEFDYAGWLRQQGFSGTAFCDSAHWKTSEISPGQVPLTVKALSWRDRLVHQYEMYFEGRDLAVLSAMTLGDKSRLDAETRDLFSQTGASHILALSGLHLSILFMLFNRLVISRCRRTRFFPIVNVMGIGGLWVFAFMAGLPLSLLRAVIMFTVMQTMVCLRRDSFSINNMGLAALVLLLISPQALFDVGFQLSFVSVLSILLLSGTVVRPRWMEYSWFTRALFDIVWVSCCAQLGTAPLVAYYFHTFPLYNLLANLVAIPLAYGILATAVAFFVLPVFQSFWAILLGIFLALLEMSLSWLSDIPGAVISLYPSIYGVGLCYGFLLFFLGYWLCRNTCRLYLSALSLCLLAGVEFYVHRPGRLVPQLIFYHTNKVPLVHAIASAQSSYLWSNQYKKAEEALIPVKRTFWTEENIVSPVILDSALRRKDIFYDHGILGFRNCRVGLCHGDSLRSRPASPFPVDYLLLARGERASLSELLKSYQPKVIILDGSLTDYYYKKYSQEVRQTSCEWYDIRKQGALMVYL